MYGARRVTSVARRRVLEVQKRPEEHLTPVVGLGRAGETQRDSAVAGFGELDAGGREATLQQDVVDRREAVPARVRVCNQRNRRKQKSKLTTGSSGACEAGNVTNDVRHSSSRHRVTH